MSATREVQLAPESAAFQIARLSRDHIEQGLGWSWTAERVLRAIRHRETNVAVICSGDTVDAFGIMRYRDDDAHLALLAVRPACRRQGLATRILQWLESVAMAAGAERIVVECRRANGPARQLYAELGYHERWIEHGMYRDREDGIRLEKWFRPHTPVPGGD